MGSGRACAAPGSAGLRPHREVRRGGRRRRGRSSSAGAAAAPPGRGTAGRAAGAGRELHGGPQGAPAAVPLSPAAVPPPGRRSSPGDPCAWAGTARGSAPRGGCVGTRRLFSQRSRRRRRRAAGAGVLPEPGGRARPRPRALEPPVGASSSPGAGAALPAGSVPGGAWFPPAPGIGSPGPCSAAQGSDCWLVTCSSACCFCSTLEPPRGDRTVCAGCSWKKEIEPSRLVLIFICLKEYVVFLGCATWFSKVVL